LPSICKPLAVLVLAFHLSSAQSAEGPRLPATAEVTDCTSDPATGSDYWEDFVFTCEELRQALTHAKVVPESKWRHEYSHVAGGDRYGHLFLADGIRVRWMARPGGLGWLEWPNGQKLHLVLCCSKPPRRD
jgi:hypothetical protein